jgi:hypothetical protein
VRRSLDASTYDAALALGASMSVDEVAEFVRCAIDDTLASIDQVVD